MAEYQGTKEELAALMIGEVAGTTARFVVDWYITKYVVFPILIGILFVVSLFSTTAAAIGLVLLVAICVLWILLACVQGVQTACGGNKQKIGWRVETYDEPLIHVFPFDGENYNPAMTFSEWIDWRNDLPSNLQKHASGAYAERFAHNPDPGLYLERYETDPQKVYPNDGSLCRKILGES